jgi:hypothetical protein
MIAKWVTAERYFGASPAIGMVRPSHKCNLRFIYRP